MIEIYTDGSAMKNRSGWGFVVLVDGEKVYEKAGKEQVGDTNQLMELIAAMEACDWAMNSQYYADHDVTIYSDSAYLINCYKDKWYISWENNGWKNSKGETVANLLEWRYLVKIFKNPKFTFEKVKAHCGHLYNERADALATGKAAPVESENLTTDKKYDTIYIKLSEILLKYSMKKIDTKTTINMIMELIDE